jgi:phosphoglycerate dehydrogenase-like enzyme
MVNADVLARAKPRLHLINIGRGALIDHDALLAAVERDALGRATLDVTEPEPLPAGHPLYMHPKVRISPHTSAISTYIQHAMIDKFMRNLHAFETGAPMEDVVDPDAAY